MSLAKVKIPNTNFVYGELIPLELFDRYGDRATRFLSLQLIEFTQNLREFFGKPMTINNKVFGGNWNYRGVRYIGCNVGTEMGEHYRGMAIDFNVQGLTDLEARQMLVDNYKELGVTIIEDNHNGWVHCGFPIFYGHENDLAIFDMKTNALVFLNDWEASKYKVKAG